MTRTAAVHIWDLVTIHSVGLLRAAVRVDHAVTAREVRRKLAREIVRGAQALAVEVAEEDVAFDVHHPDPDDDTIPIVERMTDRHEARWSPQHRPVILQGGPRDGEMLQVSDPWSGFRMDEYVPPPFRMDAGQAAPDSPIAPTTTIYHVVGWSERERAWIMAAR